MKRSCGKGQRVEEDGEEMGQKRRRKGRKRQEGKEGKSLWKGQTAEDISLLNGIPPATDKISYTYLQLSELVCVHFLCPCLYRLLAYPQCTG